MIKVGLFLVLIAVCCQSARADLGTEEYRVPILGPYAVRRANLDMSADEFGRYQLVEITDSGSSVGSRFIVLHLKQAATSGHMIVGTTDTGYFIFDTSQEYEQPQMFSDAKSWQAALKVAGVPTNIRLSDPDALASTRPDRDIHLLHYRVLHGMLGLSDDGWSGLIELGGLLFFF